MSECSVQERRKTRMQVYNGLKTFLQMSYHHMSTHTLTCMHKDSHKHIHAHTNTYTHMHTNTQDVKGVHTSTALLYTHTSLPHSFRQSYMFLFTSAVLHYHVPPHACMLVCMLSVDASMVLKENYSQLNKTHRLHYCQCSHQNFGIGGCRG